MIRCIGTSTRGPYPRSLPVRVIVRLTNGNRQIEVMVIHGAQALKPIFSFYTSHVINYISHCGLYPSLMLRRQALTAKVITNDMSLSTRRSLEKYEGCEFTFNDIPAHVCKVDICCPSTLHGNWDSQSTFIGFEPVTKVWPPRCPSEIQVTWRFALHCPLLSQLCLEFIDVL